MSKKFNYLELKQKNLSLKGYFYQLDFLTPGKRPFCARCRTISRERLNFPIKKRPLPVITHLFFIRVGELFLGSSERVKLTFFLKDAFKLVL